MKQELKQLQERLDNDNEESLNAQELAYLEQIQAVEDLKNFDHNDEQLCALAYDAAKALGLSELDAQVVAGDIPAEYATLIEVYYHDGEYLSGYTLHGEQAKLLEKVGLAKYVSGWGYHVSDRVVEKLGTAFLYKDAYELARPALERAAADKKMEQDRRDRIFAQAKRTGQPVVLDSYSDECNDPREECDVDQVTIYAMPDGSTKTRRSHSW